MHQITTALGNGLSAESALLDLNAVADFVSQTYGLDAKVRPLHGEKAGNFHVVSDRGEYFLKVSHPLDDKDAFSMQTAALEHIAALDPSIPTQRVLRTVEGAAESVLIDAEGQSRQVRLVTYLQGLLQKKTTGSAKQRENVGEACAALHLALTNFRHDGADHESAWDLRRLSGLRPLLGYIDDRKRRNCLTGLIDRFDSELFPRLSAMPMLVAHNDLNSDNILVSETDNDLVTGIIDFGDMVLTQAVCDVAVTAAYQLLDTEDPLAGAVDTLTGYVRRRSLSVPEVDILFDLILSRMATRLLITESRAKQFPDNAEYILRNTPRSWRQLNHLFQLDRNAASDRIRLAVLPRSA